MMGWKGWQLTTEKTLPKAAELHKPVPIALVICDNVYTDGGGKKALIGLFNRIRGSDFPHHQRKLAIFVSFTDIRRKTSCRLDIVNAETEKPVLVVEEPVPDAADPFAIIDIDFVLEGVVFDEPGVYSVRFWGNDEIIVQRPIIVERVKK
jgi:hypothetical protein